MEYIQIFGFCCLALSVSGGIFGLVAFAVTGISLHRLDR